MLKYFIASILFTSSAIQCSNSENLKRLQENSAIEIDKHARQEMQKRYEEFNKNQYAKPADSAAPLK
jgi:hypothetical protein